MTEALQSLDPLWNELFPAEQARIVRLLVEQAVVSGDGVYVEFRSEGIRTLVSELRAGAAEGRTAA